MVIVLIKSSIEVFRFSLGEKSKKRIWEIRGEVKMMGVFDGSVENGHET